MNILFPVYKLMTMRSTFKTTHKVLTMLVVLLFMTGVQKMYASHYAAADIYVTYVGAGQNGCSGTTSYDYEITLDVYKACEPGSSFLGTSEGLRIWSTNAGYDQTFSFVNPIIDTVDQLCDVYKPSNSCRNATQSGPYWAFIRHRYVYTWTAPSTQTDWKFSTTGSMCCRNGGILNLNNLGNLYVEAGLNNVTKYNNSTPRFLVEPIPFICVNQPATFLNGPFDFNTDSLDVYHHAPLQAFNSPIGYNAGYSVTDPIASAASNPFKINPLTGTATFTPTNQGKFVLAFQCDEYEHGTGIPLGYCMRDVQVTVFPCTSPPPGIDSISTSFKITNASIVKTKTQGYVTFLCPGSAMTFSINTQTDSANHNIYLESNASQVSPAATFGPIVGNGTNNVTGTFSWTPTIAELGEHTLIITTKDSTCNANQPILLKNYTVILIKVVQGLDAGRDLPICDLNPVSRQLFVKGAEEFKITWTNLSTNDGTGLSARDIINPIATVFKTTEFVVSTPDLVGACKDKDTVMVFIDTTNTINAFPQNPVILCRPDYVQLDAVVTGKGPISNMACGIGNISSSAIIDSVYIFGSPVYGTLSYDTLGATTPLFPNYVSSAKMQFLLTKEDLKEMGLRSATIKDLSFEIAKALADTVEYLNFRIGMKCTNKSSLNKTSGFESGLTNVYAASGPTLFPNGEKQFIFNTPYNWDTTRNLIIEFCYAYNLDINPVAGCVVNGPSSPILKYSPTTYTSTLFLTSPNEILAQDVCGSLTSAAIVEKLARPAFKFHYADAPALPFIIKWFPGTEISDSTILQPLSYVSKSTKYTVETYGKSGCIIRDSVDIFVPKHDFRVIPSDTAICFGEAADPAVYGGFVYKWYEYTENGEYIPAKSASCQDCPAPLLKPLATTVYKIEIGDTVFCFDTITMRVKVLPLPKTDLLNRDTIIKYGQSIQLMASGAKMYNWTQSSTLNNPNISYPIATPTGPTTYVVTGLTKDGCRSTDSVRVNIDYRDNLFVPSAFSPNGDGKNDVFRVSNLTFQRVMDFKVYNRWGQEVYFSNNNKGWDGTWKNIPQDVGNYSYFIKVAFPDGLIETYKGEVTLVR